MATYVFQHAFTEFFRAKRVLVWVLVAFGLFLAGRSFVGISAGRATVDTYSTLSSLLLFRLLPLASAIFSSGVISQEIEQKTIVYLLTRPVPRAQLLILRTLASALVVSIVTIIAAIALSFSVFGSGALSNPILYRDFKAIIVGSLAYGSLFVLISLIINRSMIVSLLFAFAWETSVPNMPGSVYLLSVSSYLTAIAQRPSAGVATNPLGFVASRLGTNMLRADVGWVAMVGMILFCVCLGAWWFTKFEYLPREDAE